MLPSETGGGQKMLRDSARQGSQPPFTAHSVATVKDKKSSMESKHKNLIVLTEINWFYSDQENERATKRPPSQTSKTEKNAGSSSVEEMR